MFRFFRPKPVADHEALQTVRAADCARIHATAFAHPWSATEFENLSAADNVLADAAVERSSGKLMGFVLSRCAADEAEILTIVVDPAYRRYGIGASLLTAHCESLLRRGVRDVFLEVDETNMAARQLYARQGFGQVGRREAYYRRPDGRPTAALVLKKMLG